MNAQERNNAMKAVAEGLEDKFVWNIEMQGAHRPYRIIQKRGEIVDCEDFIPVGKTYPTHPLTLVSPGARTIGELKDQRRSATIKEISGKIKNFENKSFTVKAASFSHIPD